MRITDHAGPQGGADADAQADLKEIVMGLHWDPPEVGAAADPADLDALCVLFDAQGGILEVIHPGHPRNGDGSVIHTGDSRTGASAWDDERIFVFLEALPPAVAALSFVVVSTTGRAFHEIRGAFCHVSDRASEDQRLRLDLTALAGCSDHAVATLRRGAAGWRMSMEAQTAQDDLLPRLRTLLQDAKRAEAQGSG